MAYLGTQPAVGSFKRLDDISASFNDSTTTFTEGKIAAGSVTNAKLGANAVTQAKVAQNAIGRVQMADDAVASESLAPLTNLFEDASINASAFGANVNIDILDNSVVYSTAAADTNICINFRGDSSTTLTDSMTIGNSITAAVLVTNTGTPFFISNTQVDGALVVPKVQGGSQLTGGNANSTDIYTITVLKTAGGAFTMFLSQSQFA